MVWAPESQPLRRHAGESSSAAGAGQCLLLLYHEKQESALCGRHCLKRQGPYFDAGALADIALELDRKEMALMMSQGMTDEARSFLKEQSGNVDEQGNFSVQVLSEAVQRMFKLTLEDARHEEVRPLMRDPAKLAEGFVINRYAHWLCMRKLDGQWWRINSSEEMPERVTEFALGANLAQLTQDGWSVFVVKGGKLPAQAPQYEGEARNWTDTSKPPAGAGWSMTGGNASSAPKFQAFTGSGQTLGGSSGGGGGGGPPSPAASTRRRARSPTWRAAPGRRCRSAPR